MLNLANSNMLTIDRFLKTSFGQIVDPKYVTKNSKSNLLVPKTVRRASARMRKPVTE